MAIGTGSGADERIEGTEGADVLLGAAGDDVLVGGAGDDVLRGDGTGRAVRVAAFGDSLTSFDRSRPARASRRSSSAC